jgi:hypothetical protein
MHRQKKANSGIEDRERKCLKKRARATDTLHPIQTAEKEKPNNQQFNTTAK